MARLRKNNVFGTAVGNPITVPAGAGTANWTTAPNFDTLTGDDYYVVVVEPGTPAEDIRYLTAYTSGATSGTVTAAKEGSTGSNHGGVGVAWQHVSTAEDFNDGGVIIHKFSVAYNDASLTTGIPVMTPAVGDILHDAWFEVDTAWDGTTPSLDVGQFTVADSSRGWFNSALGNPLDVAAADISSVLSTEMLSGGVSAGSNFTGPLSFLNVLYGLQVNFNANIPGSSPGPIQVQFGTVDPTSAPANVSYQNFYVNTTSSAVFAYESGTWTSISPALLSFYLYGPNYQKQVRVVPAKFTTADPILVVVSQDGTSGGASPASTQGVGVLYLATSTPIAA